MKIKLVIISLLLLLLIQNSTASSDITVRPSVMVDYSIDPAYLMPGDEGTVTITLKNAAQDYSYTVPVDSNNNEIFDLTAQVIDASLLSNSNVQVTSGRYSDVGLLGPGDSIDFTYSIKVDEDAKDGVEFLEFVFVGGGDMYDIKWKVPVNIESSGIKIINSETSQDSDFIVLDIANTRPNTIKSVNILSLTEGVVFEPAQYFIGTMDSDEMFTIQFDIIPDDEIEHIDFKAQFKNGNNWHESDIQTIQVNNSKPSTAVGTKSNTLLVIGIVGGLFAVLIIFFIVMRRRRKSEEL
jgi:hypothetical protein